MKYIKQLLFAALTVTIALTSCEKPPIEEPQHNHDEELITTMQMIITNDAGFNSTFSYKIEDGLGSGNQTAAIVDDITLGANANYKVEIKVLNEEETPAEDITEEVIEESHHHLFVLQSNPTTGAGSISYTNGSLDDEGEPLNQTFDITTGDAGSGEFTVTLKHEPTNKSATTPDEAGGSTDAVAIFPVVIQ